MMNDCYGVIIHDLHKQANGREYIETKYKSTFFTDDLKYVNKFSYLDANCWGKLKEYNETRDWKPYFRNGEKMKSYSSTFCMILKNPMDDYKKNEKEILKFIKLIPDKNEKNINKVLKVFKKIKLIFEKMFYFTVIKLKRL